MPALAFPGLISPVCADMKTQAAMMNAPLGTAQPSDRLPLGSAVTDIKAMITNHPEGRHLPHSASNLAEDLQPRVSW